MICVITGRALSWDHKQRYSGFIFDGNYYAHIWNDFTYALTFNEVDEVVSSSQTFTFGFVDGEGGAKEMALHDVQYKDWSRNLRENREARDMIESLLKAFKGDLPQRDGKAYLQGLHRLGLNISKMTAIFNSVTGRLSIHQDVGTRGLTLEDVIRLVDFQPTVQ